MNENWKTQSTKTKRENWRKPGSHTEDNGERSCAGYLKWKEWNSDVIKSIELDSIVAFNRRNKNSTNQNRDIDLKLVASLQLAFLQVNFNQYINSALRRKNKMGHIFFIFHTRAVLKSNALSTSKKLLKLFLYEINGSYNEQRVFKSPSLI